MKRTLKNLVVMLALVLMWGCAGRPEGPAGLLGVTWEMTGNAAAEKLAVRCDAWNPLHGRPAFQYCRDESVAGRRIWNQTVTAIVLMRHDNRLAGVTVWFKECDVEALRRAVGRELSLEPNSVGLWEWHDGKIVSGRWRRQGRCELTAANAAYGREYSAAQRAIPLNFWH